MPRSPTAAQPRPGSGVESPKPESPPGDLPARALRLEETPAGAVAVDAEGRSPHRPDSAVGRSARPTRSQAILSVEDGAKAALDILAQEARQGHPGLESGSPALRKRP